MPRGERLLRSVRWGEKDRERLRATRASRVVAALGGPVLSPTSVHRPRAGQAASPPLSRPSHSFASAMSRNGMISCPDRPTYCPYIRAKPY